MHWIFRSENYMERADHYMQKSGRGKSEESGSTFMAWGDCVKRVLLCTLVVTSVQFYIWCHLLYVFCPTSNTKSVSAPCLSLVVSCVSSPSWLKMANLFVKHCKTRIMICFCSAALVFVFSQATLHCSTSLSWNNYQFCSPRVVNGCCVWVFYVIISSYS